MKKSFVMIVAVTLLAPSSARAQYTPLMNPLTRTTIPLVIQCPGCNRSKSTDQAQQPAQPPRPPVTNPALLRFTPNLATRQRNLAGFVAKTRAQSPENADQMEQLFASTDVFAAFAQGLAPQGLRIDNVADCYAAYWITAWEAAHGIVGSETSRAQAQAVKAQVSRALLSTPAFTKAAPAQKQELAEALLIQAALIGVSMEAAASDGAQMTAIGTAVRQGAKAMGLDLDAMTLGEAGFTATKETGARDALPKAAQPLATPQRAAALNSGSSADDKTATYAMIAAAGGAAIAGAFMLGRRRGG